MFNGEKTVVFWVGFVVFGYSIFEFCTAVWQTIYYYAIYPLIIPSSLISESSDYRIIALSSSVVPLVIGGIIFMAIGLYIMKVGIRKNQPPTQPNQY